MSSLSLSVRQMTCDITQGQVAGMSVRLCRYITAGHVGLLGHVDNVTFGHVDDVSVRSCG